MPHKKHDGEEVWGRGWVGERTSIIISVTVTIVSIQLQVTTVIILISTTSE